MTGYVYAIADLRGALKIGWSLRPSLRRLALNRAYPEDLILVGSMAGDMAVENKIHSLLGHLRINGEWYRHEGAALIFSDALQGKAQPGSPSLRQWRTSSAERLVADYPSIFVGGIARSHTGRRDKHSWGKRTPSDWRPKETSP